MQASPLSLLQPKDKGVSSDTHANYNIFYDHDKAHLHRMRNKYGPQYCKNPDHANSHIKYFTRIPHSDNIPIIVKNKNEMYEEMRKAVCSMSGTNFVLGMLGDDGVYRVWRRPSQPCQGGEMRTYGDTHDDCTRPNDPRPTDLYYPFPDGKPLAVGCRRASSYLNNNFQVLINNESAYLRGFGKASNVELVSDQNNNPQGIIILDADLAEPTMIVTLFHALSGHYNQEDLSLLKIIPSCELQFLYKVGHCYSNFSPYNHSSFSFDTRSFLKGGIEASRDLTGGTLGNRYAYHRPKLLDTWNNTSKDQFNVAKIMKEAGNLSYQSELPKWAEKFHKLLSKEL